jgi:hypothetical protein
MDVAEVAALVALLPAFAAAIFAYLQAKSARSDARAADRRSAPRRAGCGDGKEPGGGG